MPAGFSKQFFVAFFSAQDCIELNKATPKKLSKRGEKLGSF